MHNVDPLSDAVHQWSWCTQLLVTAAKPRRSAPLDSIYCGQLWAITAGPPHSVPLRRVLVLAAAAGPTWTCHYGIRADSGRAPYYQYFPVEATAYAEYHMRSYPFIVHRQRPLRRCTCGAVRCLRARAAPTSLRARTATSSAWTSATLICMALVRPLSTSATCNIAHVACCMSQYRIVHRLHVVILRAARCMPLLHGAHTSVERLCHFLRDTMAP